LASDADDDLVGINFLCKGENIRNGGVAAVELLGFDGCHRRQP